MGLSTTTRAVKEKELPSVIVNGIHDPVKGMLLLWIKIRIQKIDPLMHVLWIIIQLFLKKIVAIQLVPLLLGDRHIRIVLKKLARLLEDVLEEMKAIVEHIII